MGKRGPKPKGKVKIEWSANFAYAIGLIVTDGCLYNDGRHMSFVSADKDLVETFIKILGLTAKIGMKLPKNGNTKRTPHVQFGDILFYKFLEGIGLTSAKSKTIGKIMIPDEYFFDFLRGTFDGDGTFYSYWDKRWRSSHMFYLEFVSASKKHIDWLRNEIARRIKVKGHLGYDSKRSTIQLKYAKREALEVIGKMYYNRRIACLYRKRVKIEKAIEVEQKQQKLYKIGK